MHEALEKNFDWIVTENPFDESSEPDKGIHNRARYLSTPEAR
jgi:hypothetical protein